MTRSRGVILTVLVAVSSPVQLMSHRRRAAPFGAPSSCRCHVRIRPHRLDLCASKRPSIVRCRASSGRARRTVPRCGASSASRFVYGVFHAVGPGHGKAVISSYLVANEETWRRGIVLSFASAGIQSVVAIVVVAIAAVLLGATAKTIGLTVHLVEIVSYGLVILIGLRLFYVKGRGFLLACRELTWTPAPVLALTSGHSSQDPSASHSAPRRDDHAWRAMHGRWMRRSRARLSLPRRPSRVGVGPRPRARAR